MTEQKNSFLYPDAQSLLDAIESVVIETDVVMDVGCGIAPNNYFRPKLHIMMEPWEEYANILTYRHQDDKSVLVIKANALDGLKQFQQNSVDSIFLLDVIEHMEKDVGQQVITEMERVACKQIVIFTPLGFMPQHMEKEENDAWGLSGVEMQEHKSGWLPDDFSSQWNFYICENYHTKDFRGQVLDQTYGAFFAVRTFDSETVINAPKTLSDIRRPLPSEIKLEQLQRDYENLQNTVQQLQSQLTFTKDQLNSIYNSTPYKVWKWFRGLFHK